MVEVQPKESKTKSPRHRSPAYPAISLRRALERARQFYAVQKQHPAPVAAALEVWEFGAKSSGGLQAISALKQYGLMSETEVGASRQVQLTDTALRIIQDEREPSPEREAAIRKAALLPKIYAEMWSKWGAGLVVDATIKFFLVREKKYNDASVADLIAGYKDTIKFAKLAESDKTVEGDGDNGDGKDDIPPAPPTPPAPKEKPIMEGERIVFTHEIEPAHGVRILASGNVDDAMLDALDVYVELQRKRLGRQEPNAVGGGETSPSPPVDKLQVRSAPRLGVVLITKANKMRLREKGYTDEQINKMKPEEALEILGI